MRKLFLLTSLAVTFTALCTPSYAKLSAKINLSSQTMTIYENGKKQHSWPISSGKTSFYTPTGSYKPYLVKKMHLSKKYNNAPMPYSVFFRGGYAIHGTKATWRLGNPASHGCVRLRTSNAKKFHDLVNKHGKSATSITITGRTPSKTRVRLASSSQVITLSSSKSRIRKLRKRKVYHAPKKRYIKRYVKRSRTTSNHYKAKGWNSKSWNNYAASMRRKQASR